MFLGLGGQPSSRGAPGLGSRVNALSAPRLGRAIYQEVCLQTLPGHSWRAAGGGVWEQALLGSCLPGTTWQCDPRCLTR